LSYSWRHEQDDKTRAGLHIRISFSFLSEACNTKFTHDGYALVVDGGLRNTVQNDKPAISPLHAVFSGVLQITQKCRALVGGHIVAFPIRCTLGEILEQDYFSTHKADFVPALDISIYTFVESNHFVYLSFGWQRAF
jgi:enoyl-[acyl-carrier-protein] reductase (NADH)